MSHKPRLLETFSTDFTVFMDKLHDHFWSDGTLDPNERAILTSGERKKAKIRHINATDAMVEHIKRLDVNDEITYYGNCLAAEANLQLVRLDDAREAKSKVIPFPGNPKNVG